GLRNGSRWNGMSAIHTCSCGAKVRLPEGGAGKSFRCPQCKTEIVTVAPLYAATASVPLAAPVAADPPAVPSATGATCPICQTARAEGEASVRCPACEQVHHRECWAEVGGCSTYGCSQAPAPGKEAPSPFGPQSAWGDTKRCPACGEEIRAVALRC